LLLVQERLDERRPLGLGRRQREGRVGHVDDRQLAAVARANVIDARFGFRFRVGAHLRSIHAAARGVCIAGYQRLIVDWGS
jgi:hypothetical protein